MATELATMVADFRTTLATEIAIGGTSGTLQSITDADGNTLANGTYYFTLDGDGTAKEHIKCTLTGTALSNIRTVSRKGVQASGTVRKHRIGAMVQITNFAHIKYMLDLLDGTTDLNASVPLAYDGVATLTPGSNELCTVEYADALTFAGAPNGSTMQKGIFEEATVAEQGTAAAIGGTGARLVVANANLVKTSAGAGDKNKLAVLSADGTFHQSFLNSDRTIEAVYSFTADSLQITTDPDSANDAVRSSYLDAQLTAEVPKGTVSRTSGEAITAGDGLYLKASDEKLYKTDADADESTFSFVGIALTTVAGAGLAVEYAPPGHVVSGLTGLTAGAYYFITGTAGTLGTTPGTRFARVGFAISTTQMQVVLPKYVVSGSFTVSGTGNTSVTTGFYPAKIQIIAAPASANGVLSIGDETNRCAFTACGNINIGGSTSNSHCARCKTDAITYIEATISARSSTGFTFNTATYSTLNTTVNYTAESF